MTSTPLPTALLTAVTSSATVAFWVWLVAVASGNTLYASSDTP